MAVEVAVREHYGLRGKFSRGKTLNKTIEDIPTEHHSALLGELLEALVDRQGLGAMPKEDMNALVVYLYRKYRAEPDGFDAFELSQRFKLRESRLKTLVALGELKFGSMLEGDAWCTVLAQTAKSRFSMESLEKGQVRFPLGDPSLYPYLQKRLRRCGSSASYSPTSEEVKVELEVFLAVLDDIWSASQSEFSTKRHLDAVQRDIKKTLDQIGATLGKKRLGTLKGDKSVLAEALDKGSKLAGIGKLVVALLG